MIVLVLAAQVREHNAIIRSSKIAVLLIQRPSWDWCQSNLGYKALICDWALGSKTRSKSNLK